VEVFKTLNCDDDDDDDDDILGHVVYFLYIPMWWYNLWFSTLKKIVREVICFASTWAVSGADSLDVQRCYAP